MSDKAALALAAIELIGEGKIDPSDLVDYLQHSSQHSDAYRAQINEHKSNILAFEDFNMRNRDLTTPTGKATTYTQSQLDKMVAEAISKAVAERDKDAGVLKMTAEQLNSLVAQKVKDALASNAVTGKAQGSAD